MMTQTKNRKLVKAIDLAGEQQSAKNDREATLKARQVAFNKRNAELKGEIAESRRLAENAMCALRDLIEENPEVALEFGPDGFGTVQTAKFVLSRRRNGSGKVVPLDEDKTSGMVAGEHIDAVKDTKEYDAFARKCASRYVKIGLDIDKQGLNTDLRTGTLSMSEGAELGWKRVNEPILEICSIAEAAKAEAAAVEVDTIDEEE